MWRVSKVYVKINRVIYKWNLFWKYIKTALNKKRGNFYFCGVQSRIHFTAHPHTYTKCTHTHTNALHWRRHSQHILYSLLLEKEKTNNCWKCENKASSICSTYTHTQATHTHTYNTHTNKTYTYCIWIWCSSL